MKINLTVAQLLSGLALLVSLTIGYGVAKTRFEDVSLHLTETQKTVQALDKDLNELRITVAALTTDLKNLREEIRQN